jgi:Uma2 family endonuclease
MAAGGPIVSEPILLRPGQTKPPEYPFHIGYRNVSSIDAQGNETVTQVPLTERDFLHPQEEDRFLLTDAHTLNVEYLRHAIKMATRSRPEIRTFSDHRIDWQVGDIEPMGPDVVVFDRFLQPWDISVGTVKVRDMDCVPKVVIEVTSPSTRHTDVKAKHFLYHRIGIPTYVIVDLIRGWEGMILPEIVAYRWTPDGYVAIGENAAGRMPIEWLGISLEMDGNLVHAYDADGNRIPTSVELFDVVESKGAELTKAKQHTENVEVWAMSERAAKEQERAEKEKERAAKEHERAEKDRQKARADALEAKLAELQGRMPAP